MKKRMAALLCVCLLVSVAGCNITGPGATTEVTATEPTGTVEQKELPGLEVYYLNETVAAARNIVQEFVRSHPNTVVNATAFDSIEEMDRQITEEIEAGEGPDVILFPDTTTVDTAKLALKDTFLDLSDFLAEDSTYDPQNYYPVLEAGAFCDRHFLMPLRMKVMFMMTTQDKFSNTLGLPGEYTLEQLMEALAANGEQCLADQSAMFTMHNFDRYLYNLIRLTGTEIVDMDTLEQTISKDTLLEYTQYAWMAYGQCLKAAKQMRDYGDGNLGQMLGRNTVILSDMSLFTTTRYYGAIYSQAFEEEIRLITYPDRTSPEAVTVDISLYAAVLNTADDPYEAYAFVRSAMDSSFGNLNEQLPVNKERTSELLAYLCDSAGKKVVVDSTLVQILGMSVEQEEMCKEVLERISAGSIPNAGLVKIFADTMHPAVHGEEDFETCCRVFEEELELYLNGVYE